MTKKKVVLYVENKKNIFYLFDIQCFFHAYIRTVFEKKIKKFPKSKIGYKLILYGLMRAISSSQSDQKVQFRKVPKMHLVGWLGG
jgi:hypothetical protein